MHSLLLTLLVPLRVMFPATADQPDGAKPAAPPDMVLRWNEVTLDAIRAAQTPPPMAARNLAMVHAAVFDAVNAITGGHSHYLVRIKPLPGASSEAAAAAAAHHVLIALYPQRRLELDRAYIDALGQVPEGNGKIFGRDLGEYVAGRVLAWRQGDGVDQKVNYAPAAAPGVWQRTPPDFAEPALPHWPQLRPFALDADVQLHPKDPPRLVDPDYVTAYKEVKELGAAKSKARTKEQTEIALFWIDGPGTCTPPGHWNQIAQTVARQKGTSLAENARLFCLLNLALADAGIRCWDCKYKLGVWRPVTAIRNAHLAGNAALEEDPEWTPLIPTPPFPSYTSGHSTFSGAGATVLADFFGDKVRFQTTSEGLPGVTRTFDSFWQAAAEAGKSRIYGGIHWEFDNAEGLAMGRIVGRYVCKSYLVALNQVKNQRGAMSGGE